MRIAITGSVATDHLMTFGGKFVDSLVPEKLASLSVSFLVEGLDIRRGGVGANIALGLGSLGLNPLLVAAVGEDFDDYRAWLERHGVDTHAIHVSHAKHTARFVCTTDADQNQIASFYPGAMSEARDIELAPIAARVGGLDLVLVGADDPVAMRNHTQACREANIAFAADPSQQLSSLDATEIAELVDGASLLFSNEYESALIERRTGWSRADVLSRVDTRVTTLGAAGARVERKDAEPVEVEVVPVEQVADPTGVGDAFRAGYLAGQSLGLNVERTAQLGCLVAAHVVETVGTQEYHFTRAEFVTRMAKAYGDDAAAEVDSVLPMDR